MTPYALLTFVTLTATGLSLVRSKRSWIRIRDFPRLQIALLGSGLAVARRPLPRTASWPKLQAAVDAALYAAVGYQWLRTWRYTPIAPVEARDAARCNTPRSCIVEANERQSNCDAARVVDLLAREEPDLVVCARDAASSTLSTPAD